MGGLRHRPTNAGVVTFPVRDARCYHLLFGAADLKEWAWLDPSELADRARRWLRGRADDHLLELVPYLIDRGEAVSMKVMDRPSGPALPPPLASQPLADVVRQRLADATHVLRIEAANPATPEVGYPGLWCAYAAAAAAADTAGGVWLDAGALRVRTAAGADTVPGDGTVHIGDHLLLIQSRDGAGDTTTTTKGLASFALPELMLFGAPTALASAVALVLQGVAQRLVDGFVARDADAGARGVVPQEVVVTGAHVARAARGASVRDTGTARLRLMYRESAHDDTEDFLVVEPDAFGMRRSRAEWLTQLAAELLVAQPVMRTVAGDQPALVRAHRLAVAELDDARRRFHAHGPGEVVFVKRAFERVAASTEFLWLVVDRWDDAVLHTRVANEPVDVPGVQAGQPVAVREAEIFDWLVTRDGARVAGGYSIDALEAVPPI